jgi:hypothetical protein
MALGSQHARSRRLAQETLALKSFDDLTWLCSAKAPPDHGAPLDTVAALRARSLYQDAVVSPKTPPA